MSEPRPIVAITEGDPAGIGPEIIVKALADSSVYGRCRPLVVGDARHLEGVLGIVGHPELRVRRVGSPAEAIFEPGTIDVLHLDLIDPGRLVWGQLSAECGDDAFRCVERAIRLALDGEVDATCTAPLNKEALHLGGHQFDGHTEIYARLTGSSRYSMMLASGDLRVVHVSTHCSLREACDRVRRDRVLEVIEIAHEAMVDLGIEAPRVGVCGLNPHAGENGLFGREELDEIIPAIESAQAEGIRAIGPLPPDTAFSQAIGGWYDIVVCMYHDQGHIPVKVTGFVYDRQARAWGRVAGVNVTLGLPIIRTSVDHGTAFEIAGTGAASGDSMVNAIDYAVRLARNRPR